MAKEFYGAEYDVEIAALRRKPKPDPRSMGIKPPPIDPDLANDTRVIKN